MVVLAAGMGSRYGGLKQLDQLGPAGETIMDYSVFDARRAGIDKVVFVIRREFEAEFRERVAARYEQAIDVHYAFQGIPEERSKPWGTAHALISARDRVDEPHLVINADDFYGAPAYRTGAAQLGQMTGDSAQVGMVGYRLDNTLSAHGGVSRGLCQVEGGLLQGIVETRGLERDGDGDGDGERVRDEGGNSHPADTVVSLNFWLMNPPVLAEMANRFERFAAANAGPSTAEFEMPTVVDELRRDGVCGVQVHTTDARWAGVTYREDAALVSAQLAAYADVGEYPNPLWPAS